MKALQNKAFRIALSIETTIYGFRYSSFAGQPSIWLDDLYVDDEMRSQGAGAALMLQLAQIAKENDCTHLAWNADARNTRGLRFYNRLGAEIVVFRELVGWALPTCNPLFNESDRYLGAGNHCFEDECCLG